MRYKLTLRNHLRKILRFSFHNTVLRVWRQAAVISILNFLIRGRAKNRYNIKITHKKYADLEYEVKC